MIIKLKQSEEFYIKLYDIHDNLLKTGNETNLLQSSIDIVNQFCLLNSNTELQVIDLVNDYVIEIGQPLTLSNDVKIIENIFSNDNEPMAISLLAILNEIFLIE